MYSNEYSSESDERLYGSYIDVKLKTSVLYTSKTVGKRLVEAFGTDDKESIAKILGFKTVGGLYKVLNGERELDFEKLQRFRNHTKCTIDWLLTGEGPMSVDGVREFNVEHSIEINDDWLDVMKDWFEFEGGEMPDTMGASFMGGWKSFDLKQKVAALRDFKRFLDLIKDD